MMIPLEATHDAAAVVCRLTHTSIVHAQEPMVCVILDLPELRTLSSPISWNQSE